MADAAERAEQDPSTDTVADDTGLHSRGEQFIEGLSHLGTGVVEDRGVRRHDALQRFPHALADRRVLHEQQQEAAQRLVRGVLCEQLRGGGAKFGDLLPVHLRDQRLSGGEVAIERTNRHFGPPGDLLHVCVGVASQERLARSGQQRFAVSAGIGAQGA